MLCIHCLHPKTSVTNSRTHLKTPQVWRRRQCNKCKKTFTTYERVSAIDEIQCQKLNGKKVKYNFGHLILDIAACFDHAPDKRAEKAYWLAKTVEDNILLTGHTTISTKEVAQIVHKTMKPFDNFAAIQFAARHNKSI